MSEIIVYTLPVCPNCDELKGVLRNAGIEFATRDIEDEDNHAELLLSGCTFIEAPIVSIDGKFYDALEAAKALGISPGGRCKDGNCGF